MFPFKQEIMLPIVLVSCVCLLIGQATSFSYGDLKYHVDVKYTEEFPDTTTTLHTFDIMLPSNVIAQAAAQEIFKKGSHQNYMTLNFLKSRFCYGNKVILQVSTDDLKFFGKTLVPGD